MRERLAESAEYYIGIACVDYVQCASQYRRGTDAAAASRAVLPRIQGLVPLPLLLRMDLSRERESWRYVCGII